ncbi:hypothetical protein PV05_01478 [Exophiala xenobiotica]|uniref:Uncharacterized protein n=1 Tax=Exophiala xenobiotica TaxID=348802 RepID=A0A0D2DGA6_9EURO|nr:uncharacterized protein PV05_01478 [Exophiala xenobiotica]KIW61347.1 hypothetical protein PV05_01478 [Exophiala xenobiotica]
MGPSITRSNYGPPSITRVDAAEHSVRYSRNLLSEQLINMEEKCPKSPVAGEIWAKHRPLPPYSGPQNRDYRSHPDYRSTPEAKQKPQEYTQEHKKCPEKQAAADKNIAELEKKL